MLTRGAIVDRYQVEHPLGRGGLAWVYAVRHTLLGTRHALKVLHAGAGSARERLLGEGRLQARLCAAHVVPVTDVVEVDGAPALVMPLVDGCTLAELLEGYRPTEAEAAALFAEIVEGVRAAHRAGVVHRDLKPANVLIEVRRGRVALRVADFGVAKGPGLAADPPGAFVGTPAYAAPEQLARSASVDALADLWSLGVILYELLAGQRPPADAGDALLAPIPERWAPVVGALLERAPERRPASADRLAEALAALGLQREVLRIGGRLAEAVRLRREANRVRGIADALARAAETWDLSGDVPEDGLDATGTAEPRALPRWRDGFVGREASIAQIGEVIDGGARAVVLVGPAGVGKTRLAAHFAWQGRWPGGAWFCDLSGARTGDDVALVVSLALGVPAAGGDASAQLGRALAGRGRILLLLDNVEQLDESFVPLLEGWVGSAPEATFLATSRAVVRAAWAVTLPVEPLCGSEAVAMFEARAGRGQERSDGDRAVVAELVELLDRLPLAIELAAAQSRALGPTVLMQRMSDRFEVLTSLQGPSEGLAAGERHGSLRAALDWSLRLLPGWGQAALAQLAVFRGHFGIEAAEAVLDLSDCPEAPATTGVIAALVEQSLIRPRGDGRFELLVSVRAYASEVLDRLGGARAGAEARHGAHYAEHGTEEAIGALHRHGGVSLRRALQREIDELELALERAVRAGRADVAARAALAAWAVLAKTGPWERGVVLLDAALGCPGLSPRDAGLLHVAAGRVARSLGQRPEGSDHLDAALGCARALGALDLEADVLLAQGLAAWDEGSLDGARDRYERAVALCRQLGDAGREAHALGALAQLLDTSGHDEPAREMCERALALHREVGDAEGEARALYRLGRLHMVRGRLEEAARQYRGAVEGFEAIGSLVDAARAWSGLCGVHYHQGRLDEAREGLERALVVQREIGDRAGLASSLVTRAALDRLQGRFDEALAGYGASLAVYREADVPLMCAQNLLDIGLVLLETGRASEAAPRMEEALGIARAAGSRRIEARALLFLGALAVQSGDDDAAEAHLRAAGGLFRTLGDRSRLCMALDELGLLALRRDHRDEARAALDEALGLAREMGEPNGLGNVLCSHGRLSHASGDARGAAAALGEAEQVAAPLGLAPGSELASRLAALRALLVLARSPVD